MYFDKFEQKKSPSEMTRLEVILDFIVFIGVSAGYVIQVGRLSFRENKAIKTRTCFFKDECDEDDFMVSLIYFFFCLLHGKRVSLINLIQELMIIQQYFL